MEDLRETPILIVDDEDVGGKAVQISLNRNGFSKTHVVHSGKEALDYLGIPQNGQVSNSLH